MYNAYYNKTQPKNSIGIFHYMNPRDFTLEIFSAEQEISKELLDTVYCIVS